MSANNKKKTQTLLTGTIIYTVGNFGTKILSFLIVPLYTYYILPDELGTYDLFMTTVSLLSPLLTMRISEATYRWMLEDEKNSADYLSATCQFLIRNCIIGACVIAVANHFYPIWNCRYFVVILIGDRVLECMQMMLRGFGNRKLYALSGICSTFFLVTFNFIKICCLHQGVTALLQSVIYSQVLTILLVLLLERRLRIVKLRGKYRELRLKLLRYAVPLVPSSLCWWVMGLSDRYLIRWLLGSAANGIYAVACKFPSVLQTFFAMFNQAWTDMALAQTGSEEETKAYVGKVFRQVYRLSFGAILFLIPFTKLAAGLIVSDAYKSVSVYTGFLYIGAVFQGFSAFCSVGYLKQKKTRGVAMSSAFGAIVNVVIDFVLIRYIGIFAASLSTFLGFFAMWLIRMREVNKVYPIPLDKRLFGIYFAASLAMAAATIWTKAWQDLLISAVTAVIVVLDNRENAGYIVRLVKEKYEVKR